MYIRVQYCGRWQKGRDRNREEDEMVNQLQYTYNIALHKEAVLNFIREGDSLDLKGQIYYENVKVGQGGDIIQFPYILADAVTRPWW